MLRQVNPTSPSMKISKRIDLNTQIDFQLLKMKSRIESFQGKVLAELLYNIILVPYVIVYD